ncbi:2-oxo-4-hydroxy-4-carboxy-5-ureidoimidazoline decarboxylase [Pseudorhodoferax sp.]|uniref:2-oxo-4-hydroxy-4-carboxy-5-ureidoimidazoline decarboxylase n=1 Tax=Pseudorhodoferax sp. TaxID=1993553 RepID=UPI0039E626D3
MLTLAQLNQADRDTFVRLLAGIYEYSPWIAERSHLRRPADGFVSLAQLQHAMVSVVRDASEDEVLSLIRAHPELAGKAMEAKTLTEESTHEQNTAGLTHCSPAELEKIQRLNAEYNTRFGWPFILAVRGPRGTGLTREQIIATFERRVGGTREYEFAECVRNIHRIAQLRLNEKFGYQPTLGEQVWDWAEALARHSEPGYAEHGQLTVTYLTDAHRACAAQLADWMRDSGFDEVGIDAVGNVVGIYHGQDKQAPRLLTGSHYDTVRNGGKYDGRLGVLLAMAVVRQLHAQGRRPRQTLEVVGFAEEEGQRYRATFLGSGALVGQFDPDWLDQADADGITMRQAMRDAGLPATMEAIGALKRDPALYQAFIEVHIEQGPVLDDMDLPLGVVTSINGSARYRGEYVGVASHAGTTPMNRRRDAAVAAAELALYAEARASADEGSVATVGMLEVPNGSINVVPGRCSFSLDMRAPTNPQRDAMVANVKQQAQRIAERRRVSLTLDETMIASAAPSHPDWQARWEAAVRAQGLPVFRLPSGAGHDAMKLHELVPQAMLFVRGGNAGISHNPLETVTADDTELAARAFQHLIEHL